MVDDHFLPFNRFRIRAWNVPGRIIEHIKRFLPILVHLEASWFQLESSYYSIMEQLQNGVESSMATDILMGISAFRESCAHIS
jgi:hypothetical protein